MDPARSLLHKCQGCACGEGCCTSPHSLSHRYICRTRQEWRTHFVVGWDKKDRRHIRREYRDHCQQPDPVAVLEWRAAGQPALTELDHLTRLRRVI